MTTTAEAAFRNYNAPLPKYYTAAVIHVILAPLNLTLTFYCIESSRNIIF